MFRSFFYHDRIYDRLAARYLGKRQECFNIHVENCNGNTCLIYYGYLRRNKNTITVLLLDGDYFYIVEHKIIRTQAILA